MEKEISRPVVLDMELDCAKKSEGPAHWFSYEAYKEWQKEVTDSKVIFKQWLKYLD